MQMRRAGGRSPALRRRLTLALATAEENLMRAQAEAAVQFIHDLGGQVSLERGLGMYMRLLSVPAPERRGVAIRALALLGRSPRAPALAAGSPDDVGGAARRLLRRLGGRRRDRLRSGVTRAAARAERSVETALLAGAAELCSALHGVAPQSEAVQLYIESLGIPPIWAERVFHHALGRVGPAAA